MAESEDESGGGHGTGRSTNRGLSLREQDRLLPIANVGRIMKKALPANGKISKEAKETVQECVSEFISFITGEASEKCQREKRKTINGDDLLWAMTTLGFEDYVEPLKIYLQQFRDMEGEKCVGSRGREGGGEEGGGFMGGTGGTETGMMTTMMTMTMSQQQPEHRQGHVYGSSGAHQTAVSSTGYVGRGPSYSSRVSSTGRPS